MCCFLEKYDLNVCKQFYLAGSLAAWGQYQVSHNLLTSPKICKLYKHSFIITSNATYEWGSGKLSYFIAAFHLFLCTPGPKQRKPNDLFLWFIPNNASDQDISNKNFYSPWSSMDSTEPLTRVAMADNMIHQCFTLFIWFIWFLMLPRLPSEIQKGPKNIRFDQILY